MPPKRSARIQKRSVAKKRRTSSPDQLSDTVKSDKHNEKEKDKQTKTVTVENEKAAIVDAVLVALEKRGVIPPAPAMQKINIEEHTKTTTDLPSTSAGVISPQPEDVTNQVRQSLFHTTVEGSASAPRTQESIPGGAVSVSHTTQRPRSLAVDLNVDSQRISSKALSDRTKTIYFSYWNSYVAFCNANNIVVKLPITDILLVNFLASLFMAHYRVSTIASHVSALSYINKLFGYSDFSHSFLVKQFLKGASNLAVDDVQPDTRLPITYALLQNIVMALPQTINNFLHRVTFSTMCILAFNGFLRIGEICVKSANNWSTVVQYNDVQLIDSSDGTLGLEITLRKYKHSKGAATLFMPVNTRDPIVCPVNAVRLYLAHSSHSEGPLFQLPHGQAVSYSFFNLHLKNVITFLGFDTTHYKSHSFHIGAATHAAVLGFSDDAIQKMGRWKSNALQNYIRLPQLKLP